MELSFAKVHGLGNDFLVIDARGLERDWAADARRLCDRHRGVGGDGLLLLLDDAPRMRVVNADGSVPEMCGNGLRCFVKHVVDRHGLPGDTVVVETDAGALTCRFRRGRDGRVDEVAVDMGTPTVTPEAVPVASSSPVVDQPLTVGGVTVRVTGVGTGNPHMVLFDTLDEATRLRLGPLLTAHPLFPAQANVEFCAVLAPDAEGRGQLRCDVFERGCGWTQACGTGATAAASAAVRLGLVPADRSVRVQLPGGWLTIDIAADGAATMTGPAAHVFDGVVTLN